MKGTKNDTKHGKAMKSTRKVGELLRARVTVVASRIAVKTNGLPTG